MQMNGIGCWSTCFLFFCPVVPGVCLMRRERERLPHNKPASAEANPLQDLNDFFLKNL
jgi:hypothetical protein